MSDTAIDRQRRDAARLARREAALAARPAMSPSGPAPDQLRLATWNLNSLRARLPAVDRFLTRARPDVLCLQETKAAAVSDDARRVFDHHGYGIEHVGPNAYNGVAIAARHPIVDVQAAGDFDDEALDREPRLITAVVEAPTRLRVASVYVPHGRTLDHWHYHVQARRSSTPSTDQARAGSATRPHGGRRRPQRRARPTATSSTPTPSSAPPMCRRPSATALAALYDVGLVDIDAAVWGAAMPDGSRGGTTASATAATSGCASITSPSTGSSPSGSTTTWIDHTERGAERPSDHAALVADFTPRPGRQARDAPQRPQK